MNAKELKKYVGEKIDEDYYSMTWVDFSEDPKVKAEYAEMKKGTLEYIDTLTAKEKALEQTKEDINKNLGYLYELPPDNLKAQHQIKLLEGLLIAIDDNIFDAQHEGE